MASAYATYEQFRRSFGQARTAALSDGSEADRQLLVNQALAAGSSDIDEAAFSGGFVTPIDPAAISNNPDIQARLTAQLETACITLAGCRHIQRLDTTEKEDKSLEKVQAWLNRLRSGDGLPVSRPLRTDASIEWIGQPGESDRLTPGAIAKLRTVPL